MKRILTQKIRISALSLILTSRIFSDVAGNEVNGTFNFEFDMDAGAADKKYFVILDFRGAGNDKVKVVYRMVEKPYLIVDLRAGNGNSFQKVKNGMQISQSPKEAEPSTTLLRIHNLEEYECDYGWTNTTACIQGLTLVLNPGPLVTIYQGNVCTYSRADLKEIKIQALPRLMDEVTAQFNDKKITKAAYTKKKGILMEATGQIKPIDDQETLKARKKELESKLKELNNFFRKGLITKEEYTEKKKALLDGI